MGSWDASPARFTCGAILTHMRLSRAEVAELLNKWLSEQKLLDCSICSSAFEARFRARLFKFDGDVFGLGSDDHSMEFVFEFYFWTEFTRGDTSESHACESPRTPLICLGSRKEDDPDILTIAE